MHLRDRLRELNGSIVIEEWYPTLQRERDVSIMEKLSRLPGATKRELEHANQCRKYIRVITIAEMASLCGRYIPPDRFNGRWRAKSSLKWTRQPPPTGPMWDKYRQLIKRAFCFKKRNTKIGQQVPLDQPLGQWYRNARRHITYTAYRTRRVLFIQQSGQGPLCYDRYETNEKRNYFVEEGTSLKLPIDAHPVTTTLSRNGNLIADQEYNNTENTELTKYQQTDNDEEEVGDTTLEILQKSDTLIACSDGSYDPITSKAAFNWRVVTDSETGLTQCSAPINTNPKYMNSYRAEYAGIRSLVKYLKARELYHKKITIYCDSKSCVNELNNKYELSMTDLDKPESDIIRSIKSMASTFKTLQFEWVKGHQDDDDETPFDERPLPVRLNIACDIAAKECMRKCIKPNKRPRPMEGAGATLYLGTNMVTTEMKEQIQYAAQVPQMRTYIRKRFKCTEEQIDTINWSALGRAKKRLKLHQSIRMSKMIYGWLNVGIQKKYTGQDDTCPCCGNAIETQIHLYRCKNEKMRQTLQESISSAKTKMVHDGIPSKIYNSFIGEICRMAKVEHPDKNYDIESESHQEIILSQRQIIMKEAILSEESYI